MSPQIPRVIPGHGRRQTSSPTWAVRTVSPIESTTSMSWPSAGKPSATGLIGSVSTVVRKQAPTSVPPLMFTIGTRAPPTRSKSHMYGSGFHGSPVVQNARSDERFARGSPFGISARTSVGERPSIVTCSDSTSRQRRSSGQSGAPSAKTIVAPTAPPPTTVHGPMIQPMSVAKWMRSPRLTSSWYATSRAIETRKPPCTCSAPFGRPVVPDV